MGSISKSNRSQADYFELLVCQYICNQYNIVFDYLGDIEEQKRLVLDKPNGSQRLNTQDNNLVKLEPEIKRILDREINKKGNITEVLWIGRNLSDGTTSDIDVVHSSNNLTRFSIKSIAATGTGTLKNIGARNIKKYLNIDFSDEYKKMWFELRTHLNNFSFSQKNIKEMVESDKDLLCWATENGKKYQSDLNKLCFDSFNRLSLGDKINLLNYITDCKDEDLYVVIVNSVAVIIYKPIDKNLDFIRNIEAKEDKKTESGYSIYVDNKPTYRVQTNNTNGIGISAYCQRIFWI